MRRIPFIVCALLLIVSGAEAVVLELELDPSALVFSPGDSVSLDLVASGLAARRSATSTWTSTSTPHD